MTTLLIELAKFATHFRTWVIIAACTGCLTFSVALYNSGYQHGVEAATVGPLDPKIDFGAKCDGFTDDTAVFVQATKIAQRLGLRVSIPNNCLVHNLITPGE